MASTLQEIVGMYKPQDNFTGIDQGIKTGSAIGSQLLERQLQQQRLASEMQYKQQELNRQVDQQRLDSLDKISKTDDPTARKMMADAHNEIGTKRGYDDSYFTTLLSKSDDTRQAYIQAQAMHPALQSGDPRAVQAYQQQLVAGLNQAGGDPHKTVDFVNKFTKFAQDRANIEAMNSYKSQQANVKTMSDRIKRAAPFALTGQDNAMFVQATKDPAMMSNPDFLMALSRAEGNMREKAESKFSTEQQQKQATTGKTQAETSAIPERLKQGQERIDLMAQRLKQQGGEQGYKREDAAFKSFENSNTSFKDLNKSKGTLGRIDDILQSGLTNGMNSKEATVVAKDIINAFSTGRPSASAEEKLNIQTSQSIAASLAQKFSNRGEEAVTPDEVRQLVDLSNKAKSGIERSQASVAQRALGGMVSRGQISEEGYKNWWANNFPNTDYPGFKKAKAAEQSSTKSGSASTTAPSTPQKSAPQQSAAPGGSYSMGGSHAPQQQTPAFKAGDGQTHTQDELKSRIDALWSTATPTEQRALAGKWKQLTGQEYKQ